jgi:hypothetical protein
MTWQKHIPPNLVVGRCRRTLIASGREDLQVEHPVCGGQSPAFHFHPTLARVQGSALVRNQVVGGVSIELITFTLLSESQWLHEAYQLN